MTVFDALGKPVCLRFCMTIEFSPRVSDTVAISLHSLRIRCVVRRDYFWGFADAPLAAQRLSWCINIDMTSEAYISSIATIMS